MPHFDPYDSLVPVFLETEIPKRVHQIGTAIFRELWGEPFLITVAHVTDELKNGVLLVPTAQGLSLVGWARCALQETSPVYLRSRRAP